MRLFTFVLTCCVVSLLAVASALLYSPNLVSAQAGTWSPLEPAGEPTSTYWVLGGISDSRQVLVAASAGVDGDYASFFISRDAGQSWEEVYPSNDNPSPVWDSVAMSSTGQIIIVGGRHGLIYISTDTGASWNQSTVGVNYGYMSVAISNDGQVMLAGDSESGEGKLYLSTNAGASWSVANPTGNPEDAQYHAVSVSGDGQTMLAHQGDQNGGNSAVYRSQDGGETWETVGFGGTGVGSTAISQDGQIMLVGQVTGDSFNRAYISQDGGENWTDIGFAVQAGGQWQVSLSDSGRNALILSDNFGNGFYAYYSENFGESWEVIDLEELFDEIERIRAISTSGD